MGVPLPRLLNIDFTNADIDIIEVSAGVCPKIPPPAPQLHVPMACTEDGRKEGDPFASPGSHRAVIVSWGHQAGKGAPFFHVRPRRDRPYLEGPHHISPRT